METIAPEAQPSNETAVDKALVLKVAQAIWRANYDGGSSETRKADWNAAKSEHVKIARKIVRQLAKDNIHIVDHAEAPERQ